MNLEMRNIWRLKVSTSPISISTAGSSPEELGSRREAFGLNSKASIHVPSVRRIIHLAKHCVDGNGHVHVAVDLACVQAEAGCEVLFVSCGGTYEAMLEQNGIRHILLEQDQNRPLSLIKTIWRLSGIVRSFRPDILHAHMMGSAIVGYLAALVSNARLVTTVHNSFDSHSWIMRLGKRVVAVSNAEKLHLVSRGFPAERLDVVMNAPGNSPRERVRNNDYDLVLQRPCIATVCGLHRRKGVFDLLEAFKMLNEDVPGWKLYIAGDGPDRKLLEDQAIKSGIADRVTFLGAVPAPRVLYEQTDIFALCSYADPCSLVIGEARSAGCAIVATAVGGTSEMLEFGRAGKLVPPGEPIRLARELGDLMRDPEARKRLRQASREGAEIFDVHRLLSDYDIVYQSALAGQ
jgi:glycosyltransferase involved in cell wall biosynthesis